jgi:hypothetical protein
MRRSLCCPVKLKKLMRRLSGETLDQTGERDVLRPRCVAHGADSAAGCFIAHSAYRALERLMSAASAYQLSYEEPSQRCFRDALAATQRPSNNWDSGRTAAGSALLARIKS